tara:strand:- start:293 stop:529 length:237 start_codon:yes stop_codon:yes gene_type:complete
LARAASRLCLPSCEIQRLVPDFRSGAGAAAAITRARQFLMSEQQSNVDWPVSATRSKKRQRIEETAPIGARHGQRSRC